MKKISISQYFIKQYDFEPEEQQNYILIDKKETKSVFDKLKKLEAFKILIEETKIKDSDIIFLNGKERIKINPKNENILNYLTIQELNKVPVFKNISARLIALRAFCLKYDVSIKSADYFFFSKMN